MRTCRRLMDRVPLVCWLSIVCVAALNATAADSESTYWNQFRGSDGSGLSAAQSLPVRWSDAPTSESDSESEPQSQRQQNIRWKTAVKGRAWSSPVVWEDQIWVTSATEDGKELYAICVDAPTGKISHDITVFQIAEPMFCYPFNSYASSTPVVERGRLWVHYGSAGTACLDTASGEILWARQDLPCDHHRGPGSSPIIFEDLLIVNFDGYDQQYVVALNKHTGQTVWKKDRTIDYGTDEGDAKKAYSTPAVFEHGGRQLLVSPAAVATICYAPRTGEELWTVYHGGFNAAARPLYSHGMVIISTEGGLKLLAVRPDGNGNVTDSHLVWSTMKATPTRPSPLVVKDHLYMVNDAGIVSCLDIHTGETTWAERIGGRFCSSPVSAEGRIYMFDEDGKSFVIAADPTQFRLLAENQLEAGCMASPAIVDGALIVRTKTHLYRLEE